MVQEKTGIQHLPHDRRDLYYAKLFEGIVLPDLETGNVGADLDADRPTAPVKRAAPRTGSSAKRARSVVLGQELDGDTEDEGDLLSQASDDSAMRQLAAMIENT